MFDPRHPTKLPRIEDALDVLGKRLVVSVVKSRLGKLLAAIPDPDESTGAEKVKRLRNLLMVTMMALQGLRTIEVHRANVEDLTERGEILTLLVRGKTRDRIA